MNVGFTARPALDELFYNVWNSGTISSGDRTRLMSMLPNASQEDRAIANRILFAIRRGWIEVDG